VARGSSDHAASYFASLTMSRVGLPVASLPMSVATLQQAPLQVRNQLALGFSQSGKSPDLVGTMQALREAGALTVAAVNVPGSPLEDACEFYLPLLAGPELSVAATKSYIAMLSVSAQLVAHWQQDAALLDGLKSLPDALRRAGALDWSKAVDELRDAERMIVIGRGLGLAIAQEAALKLKETSGLHAEAFSSAEVRHGPQALLKENFPALLFSQNDEAKEGVEALASDLAARGVDVMLAGAAVDGVTVLPAIPAHPAIQPMLLVQSFYKLANAVSVARGFDPDRPPHLRKVTETL